MFLFDNLFHVLSEDSVLFVSISYLVVLGGIYMTAVAVTAASEAKSGLASTSFRLGGLSTLTASLFVCYALLP